MKRTSMPLTGEEMAERQRNGTPDVTREDILNRARTILVRLLKNSVFDINDYSYFFN